MQCPLCGRPTEDLLDGMCAQCASERLPLVTVPEIVDATECAHCGRLYVGASWREASMERLDRVTEIVRLSVSADPRVSDLDWSFEARMEDDKNASVNVSMTGNLQGAEATRDRLVRVRFKTGVCAECSREMAGYFEATLQVRGSQGTDLERLIPKIEHYVERKIHEFRAEGRPNAFVTEVKRMKHGTDFVLGNHESSKQLANEIAEHYGGEIDESTKLFSRKDGRDVYRWTNLVRLPPYAKGDFLQVDGVLYKLLSFDRRNLALLDLVRQVRVRREIRRVGPIRVVGRSHEQQDAIVVSRTGAHVQILDPVSLKTVDLPAEGLDKKASTLPVFRHEEHLYVVVDPEA